MEKSKSYTLDTAKKHIDGHLKDLYENFISFYTDLERLEINKEEQQESSNEEESLYYQSAILATIKTLTDNDCSIGLVITEEDFYEVLIYAEVKIALYQFSYSVLYK